MYQLSAPSKEYIQRCHYYGISNLFIYFLSKIIFYQRPAGKEEKKKTKSPETCNKVFFDRNTTPLEDD
jgi:hypothetical protein